jgi:hypothetical protein
VHLASYLPLTTLSFATSRPSTGNTVPVMAHMDADDDLITTMRPPGQGATGRDGQQPGDARAGEHPCRLMVTMIRGPGSSV